MKRIGALLLCLALLISLLGCGISFKFVPKKEREEEQKEDTQTQTESLPEETQEPVVITEEQGQQMVDLIQEISTMRENGTDREAVKAYLETLDYVDAIKETEDGGLTCHTTFGVTGVWTPETEDRIGGASAPAGVQELPKRTANTPEGYELFNIAILCPFASTDSNFNLDGYNYIASVVAEYTECSYQFYRDDEVSLEFLKHLDRFDMVWFYSHGTLSNVFNSAWAIADTDPYTMTGEFANYPSIYVLLAEDFFFGRTVVNLDTGRIGVGGNFYEHYYSEHQLDGVFFHFGSCSSMKTDKLADGILSRGAAWVEGWSNSVNFTNDYSQLVSVMAYLLDGREVQEAVVEADRKAQGERYYQSNCQLRGKGDEQYRLWVKQNIEEQMDEEDAALEAVLGTYQGSYYANQGETGLTLTVYREEERVRAVFDFYNLPGCTNAKSGKYTMNVSYRPDTQTYVFTADEWIERPSDYSFVNLEGYLSGDYLGGQSPTRFLLTRGLTLPEETPDFSDVFEFGGHTYQLFTSGCETWEEAKAYCESLGGHLAVISSQEENDVLFEYITSLGAENAYFGFSDADQEGIWSWVNGEDVTYTNWHSGEPNNEGRGEDYAMFYWKFSDGQWNDGNFGAGTASDDMFFICEWDG